jgi:hypothetical protein
MKKSWMGLRRHDGAGAEGRLARFSGSKPKGESTSFCSQKEVFSPFS